MEAPPRARDHDHRPDRNRGPVRERDRGRERNLPGPPPMARGERERGVDTHARPMARERDRERDRERPRIQEPIRERERERNHPAERDRDWDRGRDRDRGLDRDRRRAAPPAGHLDQAPEPEGKRGRTEREEPHADAPQDGSLHKKPPGQRSDRSKDKMPAVDNSNHRDVKISPPQVGAGTVKAETGAAPTAMDIDAAADGGADISKEKKDKKGKKEKKEKKHKKDKKERKDKKDAPERQLEQGRPIEVDVDMTGPADAIADEEDDEEDQKKSLEEALRRKALQSLKTLPTGL